MAQTQGKTPFDPLKRAEELLNIQGMPANLEAERALLGGVMVNNILFDQVLENLKPEDMASMAHQRIFRILQKLRMEGVEMDPITVTDMLHRSGELEAVGGAEYVSDLMTGIPLLDTSEHYVHIIKQRSLLRQLIVRSNKIILDAFSSPEEPEVILSEAEQSILELGDMNIRSSMVDLEQLAEKAGSTLEQLMKQDRHVTGVPTNFHLLDEMTSGLQKTDLVVLAARPSVGKTALALSMALNAAKMGNTVAFFSLEMSAEQLFFRLLGMESKVDLQLIRTGRIPKNRLAEVNMQFDNLARLPIVIDDSPVLNVLDMGAKLRRVKHQRGLDLAVVDYMQLMRGVGRSENRTQEVSSISRGLKALAKELDVPVLALSQLSRAPEKRGEGKDPILSDLRDSGSIEQDADLVMFLHRTMAPKADDAESQGMARLLVAKQRNGPTGTIKLTFLNRWALFANFHPEGEYSA